jgi:hypothetical protein
MDIRELFEKIILANEHGGSTARIYKFSDPDGVKSGKSGWSFGLAQFDINNNPQAILCLRECGFTTDEIDRLKAQTLQAMKPMDTKLLANCTVVDRYDDQQLAECLCVPESLCKKSGIELTVGGLLALADYHNQFYMSRGGKMHTWLQKLGRPVIAEDIRYFKESLPWGQKRPDDVQRRHDNIMKVLQEAGL